MSKPLHLIGKRFGRLKVIERAENNRFGQTRWKCVCDCGKIIITTGNSLQRGSSTSCGCYNKEIIKKNLPDNTRHHLSRTPLYRCWSLMKERCKNSKRKDWMNYGGRGISVCDEWLISDNFFSWALSNGYEEGKTLDRIDVNGNYCPENCRWATPKEQGRNKRNNIHVEIDGKDYVLSELAELYDLGYETLWQRYRYGDRGERLIRPVRQPKSTKIS